MASVMCICSSMQKEDSLEHSNAKCHFCKLLVNLYTSWPVYTMDQEVGPGHLKLKNLSAYLFFALPTAMYGIWGLVIHHWKDLDNTFPMVYYTPRNFLKS